MFSLLIIAVGLFTAPLHAQLTVQQAHSALTNFVQTNPDHPALERASVIIKALEEHLPTNPQGELEQEHVDEIQTILSLEKTRATSEGTSASWLGDSMPTIIKLSAFVLAALFFKKQFWDGADISGQLGAVQYENKRLAAELATIKAMVTGVDDDNRTLATLLQQGGERLLTIKQQVDGVITRQDVSINQLVSNDDVMQRNQQYFNQTLAELQARIAQLAAKNPHRLTNPRQTLPSPQATPARSVAPAARA